MLLAILDKSSIFCLEFWRSIDNEWIASAKPKLSQYSVEYSDELFLLSLVSYSIVIGKCILSIFDFSTVNFISNLLLTVSYIVS